MATDDQQLVAAFVGGDGEAVRVVDGWILRAAWPYQRRLGNRFEDVLQDVRLEVTRLFGQGKFRGESSLKTYLWRVVSHTCLDQLRSQGRWQWTDLDTMEQDGRGPEPTPPAAAGHAERDLLLRVLGRVSADCREMWRLLVLGFSYREMSERMGVAEGTLRVRVLRCREKALSLREELAKKRPLLRNTSAIREPMTGEEASADDM
jgi:RNA polymerase sigma-70 factor (ECF subfamily)